ncbi:MAG: Trm112 family protein [Hyphomicrobiaceae bacterium]|jgi:uncharacterized protein|nr:Trm112 family protein [Hyphomicrobiaceae bacterium]
MADERDPPSSTERKLLEFLVCPLTKGPLEYDAATQELISRKANLAYPIRNGVPLLTTEASRQLTD